MGAAVMVPGAAHANADGCTKGPGTSIVCSTIVGAGLRVVSSEVALNQTIQVWSGICQYSGRWTGTYKSGAGATKTIGPKDHCSTWRAWLTWSPNADFKDDSQFCAKFKADVTGQEWTPSVCNKIKA
jgi:hypothetical protein